MSRLPNIAELIAIAATLALLGSTAPPSAAQVAENQPDLAVCPIVYPLDRSPSDRGFHYLFYGNGFFVNDDGYLLTAAHVLGQFEESPPYVVLRLPMAPPRLVPAAVVRVDRDHDVALLQVTPNPFRGRYQLRFLPLSARRPAARERVEAFALRPSRLGDPHTFDAFAEDRPEGQVLKYEFSQLDKGRPDTELLLFGHDVLLGDSGAPVISAGAVVGFIEGRWLRTETAARAAQGHSLPGAVGAAVPIRYGISVLEEQGVRWHAADGQRPNRAVVDAPESRVSTRP